MWKKKLNPQANATNLLVLTEDVAGCCGDNDKLCAYCFPVDFKSPLTSIKIDGEAVALTATTQIGLLAEINAALMSKGYEDCGNVGSMATGEGTDFEFCIKGYAVLSDAENADGPVAVAQKCTTTMVCDYITTITDGTTPLTINGVNYPLVGSPFIFGVTGLAVVLTSIETALAAAGFAGGVTVEEVASMQVYKIAITAESGYDMSFGEKEFTTCDCKQSMK